ncbi:hypothetical protein P775_07500 [Puniceibacterium antarcticum]|uniref:Uncharacterized protein n=1 Tax=Puniceibacterium antarcticum TaxID=1206336 RepID=A0A2G8RGY8_9RHOB|nr:hypothetical protein P775_07500 [Puniceibacterium antarcticum]
MSAPEPPPFMAKMTLAEIKSEKTLIKLAQDF